MLDELGAEGSGCIYAAAGATAVELQRVSYIGEPVRARGSLGPGFDLFALHLDGGAAGAADQMVVVVLRGTEAIDRLPIGADERVDLSRAREILKLAVNGRQSDAAALVS